MMPPIYTVHADDSDVTIVLTFGDLHIPPKITHEPERVEDIAREAIARRFDIPAHAFGLRIEWSSLRIRVGDTVRVRVEAAPGWTYAERVAFSESHRLVVAHHPGVDMYELAGLRGGYLSSWLIPVNDETPDP